MYYSISGNQSNFTYELNLIIVARGKFFTCEKRIYKKKIFKKAYREELFYKKIWFLWTGFYFKTASKIKDKLLLSFETKMTEIN